VLILVKSVKQGGRHKVNSHLRAVSRVGYRAVFTVYSAILC
jgi:hypothetical protein